MKVQITNIYINYGDEVVSSVQVHFQCRDDQHTINLNGYIPLTAAEYAGNESLPALEGIVRQQVADRLLAE